MSRRGNPYDNCKAESFMKRTKCEEAYLNDYRTCAGVIPTKSNNVSRWLRRSFCR
jgi:hypothetical protein